VRAVSGGAVLAAPDAPMRFVDNHIAAEPPRNKDSFIQVNYVETLEKNKHGSYL
jgi:hypothetical protein